MSRLEFNHMAWSKSTPGRLAFDLAASAVASPDLLELGLPHGAELPSDGDAVVRQLEAGLAARVGAPGGRVLVTAGASEAIAASIAGLVSAGEEVLAERPGYEPHRSLAKLFGAKLRTFTRSRERDFGGVAEAVETQLTPDTRLVVLTHLHNPSSVALAPEEIEALGALAERKGFWILCDETFRDASADLPLGTLAARGPRWVTTSSLTKSYGLGGLRIGWIAGGEDVLVRCADAQNALSVIPSSVSAALALALLPHLGTLRQRTHRLLHENHARWRAFIAGPEGAALEDAVDFGAAPQGTTAWVRLPGNGEGDELAALSASRFDLAVTPGGFFGDSRCVRVGLGGEPHRFEPALRRLGEALETFVSNRARVRSPG